MNVRLLWDGPRVVTWALHFGVGVLMAWLLAWWFPIAFYGIREAESIAYHGGPWDWPDHIMDVLAPSVAGLIVWGMR